MQLDERIILPGHFKYGREEYELLAGEFVQVRKGLSSNPDVTLQEQCPDGKQWVVRVIVEIIETDV